MHASSLCPSPRRWLQWAGSCWYYLRFISPMFGKGPVDPALERYWMPVDLYVGGAEHAVLHLLYARFWHKVRGASWLPSFAPGLLRVCIYA